MTAEAAPKKEAKAEAAPKKEPKAKEAETRSETKARRAAVQGAEGRAG